MGRSKSHKKITGKRTILVCSDPGAAQALLLLNRYLIKEGLRVRVVAGKTGQVFARNMRMDVCHDRKAYGKSRDIHGFLAANPADFIITGTSIKDDLERNYIEAAQSLNIPTLAVIDWWTNFKERFIDPKSGRLILPDWISVVDRTSASICKKCFPSPPKIAITGNPYFSYLNRTKHLLDGNTLKFPGSLNLLPLAKTILFLAEPTEPQVGYDQFEIINNVFLGIVGVCRLTHQKINLIVKFHPNGEKEHIYRKYSRIIGQVKQDNLKVIFIKKQLNVAHLISIANYVWGMNTTPLLEAMIKDKLVSSFHPGINTPGIPFLKSAGFCPSVDKYCDFGRHIKLLLTSRKFYCRWLEKQRRYIFPKDNFIPEVLKIVTAELIGRN